MEKCRNCGVILTDENQYPSNEKYRKRICKECQKKETRTVKEKQRSQKICVICGDKFFPKGSQKTCSKACSKKLRKKTKQINYDRVRNNPRRWREFLDKKKNDYHKNKEKYKEWMRKSRLKNREKWNRERRRYRKEVAKILGKVCVICKGKWKYSKRIEYHEIYGRKHPTTGKYILKHIEDFVPLCGHCHKHVHWCMEYLGLSWNQIVELRKNVMSL